MSSAAGSSPRYRHPPSAIRHPPAPVLPSPPPGIRGMMLEFPQPDRPDLSPIPTGASYWPQAYPLPSGYGAVPSGQQLDWEWSRCHVNSSIYSTHTPTAPGLAHRACILRDVGSVCWGCCHRQDPIELDRQGALVKLQVGAPKTTMDQFRPNPNLGPTPMTLCPPMMSLICNLGPNPMALCRYDPLYGLLCVLDLYTPSLIHTFRASPRLPVSRSDPIRSHPIPSRADQGGEDQPHPCPAHTGQARDRRASGAARRQPQRCRGRSDPESRWPRVGRAIHLPPCRRSDLVLARGGTVFRTWAWVLTPLPSPRPDCSAP